MPSRTARYDRTVLYAVQASLIVLLVYALAFELMFAAVGLGRADWVVFAPEAHNIVEHMPPPVFWLAQVTLIGLVATAFYLRRRSARAPLAFAVAVAAHLAIWTMAISNPYSDGPVGFIIVLVESGVLVGLVHLLRRRFLR